jgi:hypothetical protein
MTTSLDYLWPDEVRLEEIMELLILTEENIPEVADRTGRSIESLDRELKTAYRRHEIAYIMIDNSKEPPWSYIHIRRKQ